MLSSEIFERNLPPTAAAVRLIIVFSAVLSIPLAAARTLGLSAQQTSSWVFVLYGLPSVLSLLLIWRTRQPILYTGNLFIIIFIARLENDFSYAELTGACILAGAAVFLISALGLMTRLADLIPMPVIFGLLAGAVMPFVSDIFTISEDAPALVIGTFLVYLTSRWLSERIPPILPALAAGLIIAALTGAYGDAPDSVGFVLPEITRPEFTLSSIATLAPVFVILITLQTNLPALRYMQGQDYAPPVRLVNLISGTSTALGSLFGPAGPALSLPATSLVAGPQAGAHALRYRAAFIASVVALLVGLFSGIAAEIAAIIPLELLLTLAGLAVVNILANALQEATQGSLKLGPLFAFAVALSDISLLGFGAFFWGLVIGTGVSLLLERDALRGEQGNNDREIANPR